MEVNSEIYKVDRTHFIKQIDDPAQQGQITMIQLYTNNVDNTWTTRNAPPPSCICETKDKYIWQSLVKEIVACLIGKIKLYQYPNCVQICIVAECPFCRIRLSSIHTFLSHPMLI